MQQTSKPSFAVIFDMDGVLVDNFIWHLKAWENFCTKQKKKITADEFRENLFGGSNADHLKYIFGPAINNSDLEHYSHEKEAIYRSIYNGNVIAVEGLFAFLNELKSAGTKLAIATSAEMANVEFVLTALNLNNMFDVIVDASMISKGKPDPEVFLKASRLLGYQPEECVVFEDSLKGIEASLRAGMRIVGVATTHHFAELTEAHYVVGNFSECSITMLQNLFTTQNQ